ncbi:MAG: hypothetical protein HKN95_01390 [Acidimicrobiia bacterium]|nr:hypothetical protein [Acidimicrobiia bacterium]
MKTRHRYGGRWTGRALLLLLALMATVPTTGHAQVADLSGVVRDSISNESLPNAVITVVGQGQRTLSDP